MSWPASRSRNAGSSAVDVGRRCHEVGLSLKTWSADAPISAARSAALTMPCPSGRCAPRRRPFGSIGRRVAERVVRMGRIRRHVDREAGRSRLRSMDADCSGLRALVDQHRLRIVGRLATGPADPRDPRPGAEKLPVHLVRKQLEVLAQAGLVEPRRDRPGTLGVRLDRVGDLGRELAMIEREAEGLPGTPGGGWPHEGEPLADTLARLRPRRARPGPFTHSSSTGGWSPSPRSPSSARSCSGSCSSGCSPRTATTPRRRSMRGSRCSTRTWPHSAGTCTTSATWTGRRASTRRAWAPPGLSAGEARPEA